MRRSKLRSLSEEDLAATLEQEGADAATARAAASAANGNLRRARVLVRDTDLGTARRAVAHDPRTPGGHAGLVVAVAHRDRRVTGRGHGAPGGDATRRDGATRERRARDGPSLGNRRDVEAQFKREQRRFRLDELRFGLSALTGVYRERLIENLEASAEETLESEYRVGASLRALDAVAEANRRLVTNMDESLLLHDLMFSLMEF